MKMHNPMLVQSLTTPGGIRFVFNASMGGADDPGIENLVTDLLVLTVMQGAKMSRGMEKIDAGLAGALSRAIEQNGFKGFTGEKILLDCRAFAVPQKHILVVGLGDIGHFNGVTVCSMMGIVLETAKALAVSRITMPIFPNRQTGAALNLAGSAAIMACRATMFGTLPELEEIELFCTAQARRNLQKGLLCSHSHCVSCGSK